MTSTSKAPHLLLSRLEISPSLPEWASLGKS
jgi:hypothetical protein